MNTPGAYLRPVPTSERTDIPEGSHLAVAELRRMLAMSQAGNGLAMVIPWAKQKGGVTWQELPRSEETILYPLTDQTIAYVNSQSYGHELPWVGIVTTTPVAFDVADQAFDATRYDLFETEGVYDAADAAPIPRIYFLYWAKLHDDVGGGRGSLEAVAKRLGGQLVFPLATPLMRPIDKPPFGFQMALNWQLSAAADAQAAKPAPAPAPLPAAASGVGSVIAVSGLGEVPTAQIFGWTLALGTAAAIFWGTLQPASTHTRNGRRRKGRG